MARIGINALYLIPGQVGGTEIYLRELLQALAGIDSINQYFVFTNLETKIGLVPDQSNFHMKVQKVRATWRAARILWEQIVMPFEVVRHRLDVLFNPGFTAPFFSRCPSVTLFHDLQHQRHPEHFSSLDLLPWRLFLWMAARRSRTLIAPSEATSLDLQKFYRVPGDKIKVIHHGVAQRFFAIERSRMEQYFLYVSTLHPHKNHERLLRAYARKPRPQRLVLVGIQGFHAKAIKALIAELRLGDSVHVTGWISSQELSTLYAQSLACVNPSTFEGFGMSVLEALAAGIPTACSGIPPHREIAGEAALFFDPFDEDAIAAALDRIADDEPLRKSLAAAGPRRALTFTWKRTARRTLDALINGPSNSLH